MEFSRYTVFSKIRNSENYFLVNPLTKQADILEPAKAKEIVDKNYSDIDEYTQKGYLVEPEEEAKRFKMAYLDFLDRRDEDETQIFFVPWYACNFACSYCYQAPYETPNAGLTKETIDAFFAYVYATFAGRKKYITLFGGEPFLPTPHAKELVRYFMEKAREANLDVAVVTNGYALTDYIDILKIARIREVQVTLDGMEAMHNARRPLKGGGETFARVVGGIDAALAANLAVNLRVVVDRENIGELPALARFVNEKSWTKNALFKTQLGRNYELHCAQNTPGKLFERAELYDALYDLVLANPEILDFHKPAFSISKFIFENGALPDPLFDSCPACKTEWAFDYTGTIYSCTATVGKQGEELGAFYPAVSLDTKKVDEWQKRDILAISECRNCPHALLCGGGCGAVAKNANGAIDTPDCRPAVELMRNGISLYFEKEALR